MSGMKKILIVEDNELNLKPGMDGVTALEKIKELPFPKKIPVIALTSYVMDGDKDKFLAEGFAAYMSKPINITALLETIQKFA